MAGSKSSSLRKNWEAKLRNLQVKREGAALTLRDAQDRLEQERRSAGAVRQQCRATQNAAMAAVDAVTRKRSCARSSSEYNLGATPGRPPIAAFDDGVRASSQCEGMPDCPQRSASAAGKLSTRKPSPLQPPRPSNKQSGSAGERVAKPAWQHFGGLPPPTRASEFDTAGIARSRSDANIVASTASSRLAAFRSQSGASMVTLECARRNDSKTSSNNMDISRRQRSVSPGRLPRESGRRAGSQEPPLGIIKSDSTDVDDVLETVEALRTKLEALPGHVLAQLEKQHTGIAILLQDAAASQPMAPSSRTSR